MLFSFESFLASGFPIVPSPIGEEFAHLPCFKQQSAESICHLQCAIFGRSFPWEASHQRDLVELERGRASAMSIAQELAHQSLSKALILSGIERKSFARKSQFMYQYMPEGLPYFSHT